MTKLTYGKALEIAMEVVDNEEVVEVLAKLKEQLAKKNSKGGKTKAQTEEDNAITNEVINFLGTVERATISVITKAVNETMGAEYSPNKISATVKKLKDNGTVARNVEKRVAYFSLG